VGKRATYDQISTAIEVLRAYDGEMEPDNQRDVDAVIKWLDGILREDVIRDAARQHGLPVAKVRKALANLKV
jgi:hypothetical protein